MADCCSGRAQCIKEVGQTLSMEQKRGFLNAFQLKIIMVVLMLLDHLYYNLFPQSLLWAHYAARVVAPVFTYLVTEGMRYTRNRKVYILRIFAFGAAMAAGNVVLYWLYGAWIENSVLLSLAVGAAVIACIDCAKETQGRQKALWMLAVAGLFFLSTLRWRGIHLLEGAYLIPAMAVIFYYLRTRPVLMWSVYGLVFCLPLLLLLPETGRLEPQFFMLFAFVPILCYNGERGHSGAFAKYFFYLFYPLHIWIIFLLEQYWL